MGPRFDDIKKTHLLPDILDDLVNSKEMSEDALERFVEGRLDLVAQALKQYLKGIAFELVDTRSGDDNAATVTMGNGIEAEDDR